MRLQRNLIREYLRFQRYLIREYLRSGQSFLKRLWTGFFARDFLRLLCARKIPPFYICFSRGMQAIPDLASFVGAEVFFLPANRLTAVLLERRRNLSLHSYNQDIPH